MFCAPKRLDADDLDEELEAGEIRWVPGVELQALCRGGRGDQEIGEP